MKFDGKRMRSEGKLLEITPVIYDAGGCPLMLPPVIWHVPNWLAGYRDDHIQNMPVTLWQGPTWDIPGSNAAISHRLTVHVRILEDSPSAGVEVATVDASAVEALVRAFLPMRQAFREAGHGRLPDDSLS